MPSLNVRERRVETRIAYVGPASAGKATNLEAIGRTGTRPQGCQRSTREDLGEILALDWLDGNAGRFRDCTLLARLVAPRGDLSRPKAEAVVRATDGVVLVLDASPAARDANAASVSALRHALGDTARPVVVQVNKTDLPDALSAAEVCATLSIEWPPISAVAARGDGVLETLERAVTATLADFDLDEPPATDASAPDARREGNPLLSALRQLLRDTVSAHASELEARLGATVSARLEGLEASMSRLEKTLAAMERAGATRDARAEEHHNELRTRLGGLDEEVRRRGRKSWFT